MKRVPLSALFDVRYGHSLELNRQEKVLKPEDGIPFVSRKMGDNGIAAYVRRLSDVEPAPGGELTCALSGNGVLSTFVQDKPYYTAFHVACLQPRFKLSLAELLYYCVCIKSNRYRFSYGRQANRTLKDILLPDLADIPKWVNKANPDMFDGAKERGNTTSTPDLNSITWKVFIFEKLFDLKKGKRLTKANMTVGDVPFIGAIDSNNGRSNFVTAAIHPGNTITVNYNGAGVAEAFYQSVPYWASDDVNVLYPRFDLTPAIALFIATIIRQEKYRFSYGRKWHLERMTTATLHLPSIEDGTPDWNFMEHYITTLPYSSQI